MLSSGADGLNGRGRPHHARAILPSPLAFFLYSRYIPAVPFGALAAPRRRTKREARRGYFVRAARYGCTPRSRSLLRPPARRLPSVHPDSGDVPVGVFLALPGVWFTLLCSYSVYRAVSVDPVRRWGINEFVRRQWRQLLDRVRKEASRFQRCF